MEREGDLPASLRPHDLAARRRPQRRLDGPHRPRGGGRRRRLPRPWPPRRPDRRLHLRQPGDDPQRGAGPHEPQLPRVPRQEGALLAQGARARPPRRRPRAADPATRNACRSERCHSARRTYARWRMGRAPASCTIDPDRTPSWSCHAHRRRQGAALAQRDPPGHRGPPDRRDPPAGPVRHRPPRTRRRADPADDRRRGPRSAARSRW